MSSGKGNKGKVNKWDYLKPKSFCKAKEIKMKREPTKWENIFANDRSDNGLISNIYQKFIQFNIKKSN